MKTFIKTHALAICGALLSGLVTAGNNTFNEKPFNLNASNTSIFDRSEVRTFQEEGGGVFDENTRILNLGVGLGGGTHFNVASGSGYKYTRTPLFNLSYEQSLKMRVGPGYVAVGGYFSMQTSRNRYDNLRFNGDTYYYEHTWNSGVIAARGTYHWDFLNRERGEVYAGSLVGVSFQTYNYTTNNPYADADVYKLDEQTVYPTVGVYVGARWYFANRVGLFAETSSGYSVTYLTGGLSIKF